MTKDTAPSFAGAWAPGARLSGVLSKYLLPVVSSLLLIVTAACDRGALEPEMQNLWPADAKLLLNSSDLELAEGDTFRLVSTVVNGSGTVLGRSGNGGGGTARGLPRVVWKSSDPSIAVVDSDGLVEAVGEGSAVISVASGSLSTFSRTKVSGKGFGKGGKPSTGGTEPPLEPTPTSIVVSPDVSKITAIGGSVQLSAIVYDQNDTVMSSATVTWASANPEVVSVDGNGKVIAGAVGAAIVIATSGAVSDTASFDVEQVAASVAVTPATKSLVVGDTVHLIATAKDANGNPISNASFSWSSSNAGVVSVTSAGVAKALATGSVSVTATASGAQVKATSAISSTAPTATSEPTGPTTVINPGDDIQAKVNASPVGTVFTLKAGVHRLQRIQPKDGQQFIGETGAILSGAKLLTQFSREGSYYVASNQKAVAPAHGTCTTERPRCGHPEDLFLDDQPLVHVSSLAEVGSGKWYFDYATGKVYMADSPSGRKVELSATAVAFSGSAANVVIRGLTIEKYSNRAQAGAIDARDGHGWLVEDNLVRKNHGVGVRIGDSMKLLNNRILSNGQMGAGGIGSNALVEGNEIAYNNAAGFKWGWEAGGTKFVRTHNLVIRNNFVHHNEGPGLWSDIDNFNVLYEQNRVEDNIGPGIFHEISYDAIIRNNTVRRNAKGVSTKLPAAGAAGILVATSGCVSNYPAGYSPRMADDGRRVCIEVYGNTVEDNDGGIAAFSHDGREGPQAYGEYLTRGVYVHDNTIRWSIAYTGVAGSSTNAIFAPESNNRFDRNTHVTSDTSHRFAWGGSGRDWSSWRGHGQDPNGRLQK